MPHSGSEISLLREKLRGTGSGWLPTPRASDGSNGGPNQSRHGAPDGLPAHVAMWPTPLGNSSTGAGTSGRQGGMNLQSAVSVMGQVGCSQTSEPILQSPASVATEVVRDYRSGVQLFPTPTSNRRDGLQSHGRNVIGGTLNPMWVAWLMGYPPEWLSCAPSAMPSSRKPRPSS